MKKFPKIYLDMDDVQADFAGFWIDGHGLDNWHDDVARNDKINKIAYSTAENVYNLFRNLKPLQGGMRIVHWLKAQNIPFTILSAPLRGPHIGSSIQAKRDWLDEHNPGTSETAIFERNKYIYARQNDEPCILIDDWSKNINLWNEAGGIAIKHDHEYVDSGSYRRTIKVLKEILGTK